MSVLVVRVWRWMRMLNMSCIEQVEVCHTHQMMVDYHCQERKIQEGVVVKVIGKGKV